MSQFEVAQLQRYLKRSQKETNKRDIIIRYRSSLFNTIMWDADGKKEVDRGNISLRHYNIWDFVMELPDHEVPEHPMADTSHLTKEFEKVHAMWISDERDLLFREWMIEYRSKDDWMDSADLVITIND